MRYAFLIYVDERTDPQPPDPAAAERMNGYIAFGQEVERRKGGYAGERLQPIATATTVRIREGKTVTVDGPFAETREQLGGFYLVDCKDLDEALELAAMIPGARNGSVEVRPVWEM